MFDNLKPLRSNVVIKRINNDNQKKTLSGIIITTDVKPNYSVGIVIAYGVDTPALIKGNDEIYFCEHSIIAEEGDHLIIKADDILGIVNKKQCTNEECR